MIKNIGITDRIIRFVVMDALIGLPFLGMEIPQIFATIGAVLSGVLLITIISGYSPLYHALGFSSKYLDETENDQGDESASGLP